MKSEQITLSTSLGTSDLRQVIGNATHGASITDLETNSLSDPCAIAVLARWRPTFGERGDVQIYVYDEVNARTIRLVALGASLSDGLLMGFAQDMSDYVPMKASRKRLAKLVDALLAADPHAYEPD